VPFFLQTFLFYFSRGKNGKNGLLRQNGSKTAARWCFGLAFDFMPVLLIKKINNYGKS